MSRLSAALGAALVLATPTVLPAAPLEFHLTFDRKAGPKEFTGRVYVLLFKAGTAELQPGPAWVGTQPFFARDVKGWRAGETLVIDGATPGYPVGPGRITKGTYAVQAVMDLAPGELSFSRAAGNVYTVLPRVALDPAQTGAVALKLDRVYAPPPFKKADRLELVEIQSKLLTAFHGRPTRLRAGVVLPASYAGSPGKKYPVVYEIPGFSGDHTHAARSLARGATNLAGLEVIHVVLDPNCHHGHHVFADSANNGPCGRALVEELIPAIEKRFRAVGRPAGRLVTGHSSGGWSSLWLQTTYPDFFAGVWSTAPDPVDFRDFQRVNIYRPGENAFTDAAGKPRPLGRMRGKVFLWFKGFSDMETVMGHGGQLASFEAVFSPRGPDGRPRRLWDRKTGAIDPAVAKGWEKYDIRLVLERNWKALGPKLKGKLHVYMGDEDTFYLDGAARLLRQSLAARGSDAVVELFPGKDHFSLMSREMRERIAREMAATLRAGLR